jgi:hypothetical protein
MRIVCLLFVLLLHGKIGWAQEVKKDSVVTVSPDSTTLRNDSVKFIGKKRVITIESYATRFDPRKALFYAAILPGAGQVYNKKYWKIPIVYGGLGGLIVIVKYWNNQQVKFTNQLFNAINNPTAFAYPGLSPIRNSEVIPKLRTIVDQARRQRDYFAIITGFFYILQMVDAHVDAHLKEFDLNPKLHVRIEPSMSPAQGIGMGINVRF